MRVVNASRIWGEGKKSMMLFSITAFTSSAAPICPYTEMANGITSSMSQVYTYLRPVTGLMIPAAAPVAECGRSSSTTITCNPSFFRNQESSVPQMPCPTISTSTCMCKYREGGGPLSPEGGTQV